MARPSVFISYAREDSEAAQRLYETLKASGADPWLDTINLIPGQNWKSAIRDAIDKCRYFIAIFSNNSVEKRGFVQKELRIALELLEEFPENEIFIIPIRLDDCHPSYKLVRDLQWVDLFPNWTEGVSKILRAIELEKAEIKEPDDLDLFVRDHVDKSRFEKRKSWREGYSLVLKEFEGDETLYICWNENTEILEKFYRSYDGVRWYGPERLNDNDKKKVRQLLQKPESTDQ
jgi:hypothetical protein